MAATVSEETPRLRWPQSPPPAHLAGPQVTAQRHSLSIVSWVFSIVGHTRNTSPGGHLKECLKPMPEPPQLVPLDGGEQWLHSKLLLGD